MRVVIYTQEFEPITVLDLGPEALEQLRRRRGDRVRLYVHEPLGIRGLTDLHAPAPRAIEGTFEMTGMRWQDGRVRPVILVRGIELGQALLREPGQVLGLLSHAMVQRVQQRREVNPWAANPFEEATRMPAFAITSASEVRATDAHIPEALIREQMHRARSMPAYVPAPLRSLDDL